VRWQGPKEEKKNPCDTKESRDKQDSWSGKAADLVETRAQDTGNLLDNAVGSNKGSVLLSELLNELLVLVELLQVIDGHRVNLGLGSIIDVLGVTEHADVHARAGGVGQTNGATETLVALRIVLLQTNLKFNGLDELPLLLTLDDLLDRFTHGFVVQLAGHLRDGDGFLPRISA
jgi:hypothetical protein